MGLGADLPGRITRLPGGVALNIAMTLAGLGLRPAILSAIGTDPEGTELIAACRQRDILTDFVYRDSALPTDVYMAVEGAGTLVAAIADARSLEAAGSAILEALADGRLGTADAPWAGPVALDGNLTEGLLAQIAASPLFSRAQLRVAPASPGKATRLRALLGHPTAVLHVNLEEAGLLCDTRFADAAQAAAVLVARGAARALVTDGPRPAADGRADGVILAPPPQVAVVRVTGAGDTFMAAHLVAEAAGAPRDVALHRALQAAALYVSGGTPQ
jgi:sugar/nucleoside kinase (ribokinase family)